MSGIAAVCECGCGQPAPLAKTTDRSRGYVKGQPHRFRRGHGSRVLHPSASARFWANVVRDEASTCLLWTGRRDAYGYGEIKVGGLNVKAHRFAYEQARGAIPPGFDCHHRCGNRACVHPLHLALMTHAEHRRYHAPRPASCTRCGESDWATYSDGRRECRSCRARRKRRQGSRA